MVECGNGYTPDALPGDAPLGARSDEGLEAIARCARLVHVEWAYGAECSLMVGKNDTSCRAVTASSLMLSRFANHCDVALLKSSSCKYISGGPQDSSHLQHNYGFVCLPVVWIPVLVSLYLLKGPELGKEAHNLPPALVEYILVD